MSSFVKYFPIFLRFPNITFFSLNTPAHFLVRLREATNPFFSYLCHASQFYLLIQKGILPVDNQTITCFVVFGTEEESGRRRQSCLFMRSFWHLEGLLPKFIGNWKISCFCSRLCFRKRLSRMIASRLSVGSGLACWRVVPAWLYKYINLFTTRLV